MADTSAGPSSDVARPPCFHCGEPYTPARDRVVTGSGCTAYPLLQSNEVGRIGTTCASRRAPDEVHLLVAGLPIRLKGPTK